MKKHYTVPFFIPHKGCPFSCVFCRQDKISGRAKAALPSMIKKTVLTRLKTIPKGAHVEIGFFGGSFTGLSFDRQGAYLKEAGKLKKAGKIHGIRLSTRPDFISQKVLDFLKKYDVDCIELGVQSASDPVLKASKRGSSLKDIKEASRLIIKNGFTLGHQIMVGLPKSTPKRELETAMLSIKMKASQIRIYPLVIIKNTELESMYRRGLYKPLSEKQAIKRCLSLLKLFEEKGIEIIRCGLHPSEGLLSGKDIVAGPFHQAFRQKVETEAFGNLFRAFFKSSENAYNIDTIFCSPLDIASVAGHKRINGNYLEKLTGKRNIIKASNELGPGEILIKYENNASKRLEKWGF